MGVDVSAIASGRWGTVLADVRAVREAFRGLRMMLGTLNGSWKIVLHQMKKEASLFGCLESEKTKRDRSFDWSMVCGWHHHWDMAGFLNPSNSLPLRKCYQLKHLQMFSIPRHFSRRSSSSKDIQLQCLDVRALLHRNSLSTVGSSSLDLEWDNETLPESVMVARDPSWSSWTTLHEDLSGLPGRKSGIRCRSNADSDRSGVSSSSADSLEWDDVQQSLENVDAVTTELDSETRTLLVEIERLTNRTLEETGRGLMGC
ncbi:unnamed protein product [Phyllotreta striolata]|uniref:Uncharacterized protein n=1 Tax=Phyllotreta striolata TaxID=444603 RepID=A0A9N9XS71_PHYSR|nr:unnamed protein product [Phyllotreta striolata]